jgi:hypothetical protein
VLGTQEIFCIVIAGLLERDSFDLFLPEFDKPWVIHLREITAALQTSALGGPTLSTRTDACVDITLPWFFPVVLLLPSLPCLNDVGLECGCC